MGLFSNKQATNLSERERLEAKYAAARGNLLLVIAMTLINIVLLMVNADSYFLFSAFIPYYLVMFGMMMCGKFPMEYYLEAGIEPEDIIFYDDSFLVTMGIMAAIILILYFLFWLLSKNNNIGWLIAALVFFAVDTFALLLIGGFSVDMILDYLLHAWVLYYLISGVVAHYKLRKLHDCGFFFESVGAAAPGAPEAPIDPAVDQQGAPSVNKTYDITWH